MIFFLIENSFEQDLRLISIHFKWIFFLSRSLDAFKAFGTDDMDASVLSLWNYRCQTKFVNAKQNLRPNTIIRVINNQRRFSIFSFMFCLIDTVASGSIEWRFHWLFNSMIWRNNLFVFAKFNQLLCTVKWSDLISGSSIQLNFKC